MPRPGCARRGDTIDWLTTIHSLHETTYGSIRQTTWCFLPHDHLGRTRGAPPGNTLCRKALQRASSSCHCSSTIFAVMDGSCTSMMTCSLVQRRLISSSPRHAFRSVLRSNTTNPLDGTRCTGDRHARCMVKGPRVGAEQARMPDFSTRESWSSRATHLPPPGQLAPRDTRRPRQLCDQLYLNAVVQRRRQGCTTSVQRSTT